MIAIDRSEDEGNAPRYKRGGRWMVITGCLVSRHRSKSDARATANRYRPLIATVRRWHRGRVQADEAGFIWLRADDKQ